MSFDPIVHDEVRRQGAATRAALGLQLRSRNIWTGADRLLQGPVVRQIRPFKMRDAQNPEVYLESLAYNGSIYVGATNAGALYSTPDLTTLTVRNMGSTHESIAVVGSTFLVRALSGGSTTLQRSPDAVSWTSLGNVSSTVKVRSAGGVGFVLPGSGTTFSTYLEGGALVARAFTQTGTWNNVLHNGSRWLAVNTTATLAEVSTDGQNFAPSTGYAAAVAKLPPGLRYAFVLGTRFIVVSIGASGLATMYSDDGQAWLQGARMAAVTPGSLLVELNDQGAVVDGFLYVVAVQQAIAGAAYTASIISTPDGVDWRASTEFYASATAIAAGGLCRRVGTSSLAFNLARGNFGALETNTDAKELFYAL